MDADVGGLRTVVDERPGLWTERRSLRVMDRDGWNERYVGHELLTEERVVEAPDRLVRASRPEVRGAAGA